jgi:hypothetical protein
MDAKDDQKTAEIVFLWPGYMSVCLSTSVGRKGQSFYMAVSVI